MKTKLKEYFKNMSNTKKIAISVLAMVFVCLVFTGSYALFNTKINNRTYIVKVGTLDIDFEDANSNLIVLNNTYPMTNNEGLSTTGYTFNVSNNGTVPGKYLVRLEIADDNEIPIEYIKVAYQKTKDESINIASPSLSTPKLLSNLNDSLVILKDESIGVGKKDTINLKLWLDINTPNDMQNKSFKARIIIDSTQDYEDASYAINTKPIIELNKDENGNIDYIIPVNGTYTELGVASVKDDKDKLTPSDVTITGTVDTTTAGTYTKTYTVTDSDNNTTTQTRTIYVGDPESMDIKHGISQVLAMYSAEEQSANEAIVCNHIYGNDDMYLDCEIKDTLENAIADRNRSAIILTKDLTKTSNITIQNTKDIMLDLNGKTITTTTNTHNITIYGRLVIDNGSLINTSLEGTPSVICNQAGILTTNSNLYIEGPYGIGCHTNDAKTIVNGSEIKATKYNGVNIGSTTAQAILNDANIYSVNQNAIYNGNGTYTINGGTYTSPNNVTINLALSGIININGGNFTSNSSNVIKTNSTGTININDGYFKSLNNYTIFHQNGNLNINGDDGVLDNQSNYVSGTYIYSNAYNQATIYQTGGILSINGGTIYHDSATDGTWRQHALRMQKGGIAYLNGGTFTSIGDPTNTVYLSDSNVLLNVNGATINGTLKVAYNSGAEIPTTRANVCSGNIDSINVSEGSYAYIKSSGITWGTNPTFGTYVIQDDSITCTQ